MRKLAYMTSFDLQSRRRRVYSSPINFEILKKIQFTFYIPSGALLYFVKPLSFLLISGSKGNRWLSGLSEYSLVQIGSKGLGVLQANSPLRNHRRMRCLLERSE
jgi:hypothetical protein